LNLGFDHDAGQAESAHGGGKPRRVLLRTAFDDPAIAANQADAQDVIAESAERMVALAVHVIGDGAAYRDELCSRRDGQNPAARDGKPLDVPQQHAGFADQTAGIVIESDEMIQPRRHPEYAFRVEADVPVTAAHAMGQPRFGMVTQQGSDVPGVVQGNDPVRMRAQAPPGGNRSHGRLHGAGFRRKT
jgi:hypothetical protein